MLTSRHSALFWYSAGCCSLALLMLGLRRLAAARRASPSPAPSRCDSRCATTGLPSASGVSTPAPAPASERDLVYTWDDGRVVMLRLPYGLRRNETGTGNAWPFR